MKAYCVQFTVSKMFGGTREYNVIVMALNPVTAVAEALGASPFYASDVLAIEVKYIDAITESATK